MKTLFVVLLALTSIVGCEREVGPPLEISDAVIFAPLPGADAAVAYMTFTNNTSDDIAITSISSPQFASVKLHETQISDDVARMVMLDSLRIPAESSVPLVQGGKHLMLMNPTQGAEAAQSVSLHFLYDVEGLVIVTAKLQSRLGPESND